MSNKFAQRMALHLAIVSLPCAAAAQASECQLEKVTELAVNFEKGWPLVGVEVNGKRGSMVFSNHSNVTALYDTALPALGLKSYTTQFFSTIKGNNVGIGGVYVKAFKIGDAPPRSLDIFVHPAVNDRKNVWGTMATNLFPGYALDLDYANRRVRFYREKNCEGKSLGYWDAAAAPIPVQHQDPTTFYGEINGSRVLFEISSSAQDSVMNQAAVKAAGLTVRHLPRSVKSGDENAPVAGPDTSRSFDEVALVKTMQIGNETIRDVEIETYPNPPDLPYPGDAQPSGASRLYDFYYSPRVILGIDFLLTHHVLISPVQFVAYITRVKPEAFERTTTGISLNDAPPSPSP